MMVSHSNFHPNGALSLMLAVIASSNTPLLLLAGDLRVVAASTSFCDAFGLDPAGVPGRTLAQLGGGEWDMPQVSSLLAATASGAAEIHAYELDLHQADRQVRHLVLNAHKLDYDDKEQVRLLLAVADVTAVRASEKLKDDLIREKAVLLREVQHRIANSLQIIASVLMQSARRVQSDETRGHLHDAHHRLMSIASVQRQLAVSAEDHVALRSYLIQLCASLGASMIPDRDLLSIDVIVDDSVTNPDMSVRLGLIVTELVINALKHAFTADRGGKIIVNYRSLGPDWTLSVGDNGLGMPLGSVAPKAGLGTSIIEALARQLGASVDVSAGAPGTVVTINHAAAGSGAANVSGEEAVALASWSRL